MKSTTCEGKTHLVIPDAHAKPGIPNDRFEWLGNYIIEHQPDVIIDIGDSADMESLSSYDIGKVKAEGKRYVDDIAAYHDSCEKLFKPMKEYNNKHTQWKKKKYTPKLIKCTGNHENRINRAADETPALFGHISTKDLKEGYYGWDTQDFLKPVSIDGVCYSHYFASGVMGRPISGINHARTLVLKSYMSCVCGHSHMRDFWEDTNPIGQKLFGLVVGCFFEHEESYTTENKRFWRGIVHLSDVRCGEANPHFISMEELKRKYQ